MHLFRRLTALLSRYVLTGQLPLGIVMDIIGKQSWPCQSITYWLYLS